ncbi:MAG: hypothetical protein A3I75_06170 [Deltaproteobacteria bacterium RIFCSPLOWO2_02_FULL_50_16]|nr:MAG: hypothetical protein A3I75_06170 [Deltaproteobacteria bacterium RIFCSPLOWO2_02_FULL_50_16]OGQ66414.1 MAG: hypothetical protein A3F89_02625 [Deltaproteobacteria bacterium RIFCSPLOWO2_12_FULL_50_11]
MLGYLIMRLKKSDIERLATHLVTSLITRQLIQPKLETRKLTEILSDVLTKNMEAEQAVEDETRRLMEQYRTQINAGQADSQRLYMMIKRQVAKDKKFIL